ncbi:MAG: hypothetical protein RL754_1093 [Bacteroidota bacterium]|jgi:signal transduction histidine kinase
MKFDLYTRKIWWKIALIIFGIFIGVASLVYTESFLKDLRIEEQRKIELWAKAVEEVSFADDLTNLGFYTQIIQNNTTIPVILTDSAGTIIAHRNLNVPENDQDAYMQRKLREFQSSGSVLENSFGDGNTNYLYYKGSTLLTKLRIYPMVLLCVIGIYMLISYMAFSNARRSEQNKVWTGMAKETAHQIGTPLSALLGWTAYLREKYPEEMAVEEMEADIDRLTMITDRFSKVGSKPELGQQDLSQTINQTVQYLSTRLGKKIELSVDVPQSLRLAHNRPLISWTIENLLKNAADAVEGDGKIELRMTQSDQEIQLIVSDNGKGMTIAQQRKVFLPGFTTKDRGWGLGLTLAKRIVEEYHGGRLSLHGSAPQMGTVFIITLPRE